MPNHEEVVRFVILAAPRTGSNMLSSQLNSHQDILCHHELYNPNGVFYALNLRETDFSIGGMNLSERDKNPLAFLDQIWENTQGYSHVGFKMTHYQNREVFDAVLADVSILKIVLSRRNIVKTYVSKLIAEQREVWEYYGDEPIKTLKKKVYVDPLGLQADVKYNESFYLDINHRLKETNQNAFLINYEALKNSNFLPLLSFLGCANQLLEAKSQKQNPEDLIELVENYQELRQSQIWNKVMGESSE